VRVPDRDVDIACRTVHVHEIENMVIGAVRLLSVSTLIM
jgi:hypothetical protein